ncbi:MAG: zf-TFIIB domain-containing protein, partial [Deltaproteobacteria bacterium]|nr:zf-TFIIB domain-containing protein [Deltaproteobacteria bacterium]
MEGSPYRERPRLLMCPRCRELLDVALNGVRQCMRCEGLWLSPRTVEIAFGSPRGPAGTSAWWRNAIECPECATEGRTTVMQARTCGEVLVDTCFEHGLWLDRGELAQLLGTATDELLRLRANGLPVPDLDELRARREKWRADGELRRRMTATYLDLLEDEHRRRAAMQDEARREAERGTAQRLAEERARRDAEER